MRSISDVDKSLQSADKDQQEMRAVADKPHNGAVYLPQHAFLVGLCLQTAVIYLSKSDKY